MCFKHNDQSGKSSFEERKTKLFQNMIVPPVVTVHNCANPDLHLEDNWVMSSRQNVLKQEGIT